MTLINSSLVVPASSLRTALFSLQKLQNFARKPRSDFRLLKCVELATFWWHFGERFFQMLV